MAIENKINKTHTIDLRMAKYLFWMQKKWLKIWKPVFLIKLCLSRKKALVLQPRRFMWEGGSGLTHTAEETLGRKKEWWYFPPAPLKPRTTQMAKAKTPRNQEGFIFPSSVLCYDKVTSIWQQVSGLYPPLHLSASRQRWEATTASMNEDWCSHTGRANLTGPHLKILVTHYPKGCQRGQYTAKFKMGAQSAHRLISTGTGQHSQKYSTAPGAYFHFSVLTLASLFVARTWVVGSVFILFSSLQQTCEVFKRIINSNKSQSGSLWKPKQFSCRQNTRVQVLTAKTAFPNTSITSRSNFQVLPSIPPTLRWSHWNT